jgi:ribonucleoside-diphosphate reductase alpha chain
VKKTNLKKKKKKKKVRPPIRKRAARKPAYPLVRWFTKAGEDPFRSIPWDMRTARISDAAGRVVFEQRGVEVPAAWTQLATDLVASRYFAGVPGRRGRESSVRAVIQRIVRTIGRWVRKGGYLARTSDATVFEDELAHLLLHQKAAFNSPVWFNVGIDEPSPQCSACFIVGLKDSLDAILELATVEGRIFSKGSGSGTNFSSLRSSREPTRAGGHASGPVAFLRGLDALAGAIKSGGRTRRAAKMAILDADHPDLLAFVRSKAVEEDRARALDVAGLGDSDVSSDSAVSFQNENHSVRVPDAFLTAAERGAPWRLVPRTDGVASETVDARGLLREMARAAHACGDPGLHFADTIERWNPVPRTGPIRASNPCSEFVFLDDTACNLASLNLMAFRDAEGDVDPASLAAAVRVLVLAMDAIVGNAGYPTPAIARNSSRLRPLGLGIANLGALVMARGLPYDGDAACGVAAGVMAVVGGEASLASARLAARVGPFAEWRRNREPALAVLERHTKAARSLLAQHAPEALGDSAVASWEAALVLARSGGLRNAQVTCIAPTGTISFLMDCDTTGIEPELSLVKEKKLVGGGRLRLVSRVLPEALRRLGYDPGAVEAILAHAEREGTVEGAPGLDPRHADVFATAVPARPGGRSLSAEAHLRMMAAVQPFVSGAISKTVNLPADETVEGVEAIFLAAWRMGLKAVAVYRDRSKVVQPLVPAGAAPHPASTGRCHECGQGLVPDGACLLCPNCGATTGCG